MIKNPYEILIVDDHPIVLEGIKRIVSLLSDVRCDGISEVEQLESRLVTHLPYDMYILDLEFPKADGFSVIRLLRQKAPDSRILIYTMHEEPWILAKLIDTDIDGLLFKSTDLSELQKAVCTLQEGETYFSDSFRNMMQHGKEFYINPEKGELYLSDREKEVLAYVVKGFSNKDISEFIFLSENTVKTYRKRLMLKIGAKNAADLVFKSKDFI